MSGWTLGPEHPDYGWFVENWQPPEPRRSTRPRIGGPGRTGLQGRWSVAHDACRDCGKTERKHAGHGYGFCCYFRHIGEFANTQPPDPEAGRGAP